VFATSPVIRAAAFERLADRATAGIARRVEIDAVRSI
jgi:L-aminopeptidase/D-esterase-like protein